MTIQDNTDNKTSPIKQHFNKILLAVVFVAVLAFAYLETRPATGPATKFFDAQAPSTVTIDSEDNQAQIQVGPVKDVGIRKNKTSSESAATPGETRLVGNFNQCLAKFDISVSNYEKSVKLRPNIEKPTVSDWGYSVSRVFDYEKGTAVLRVSGSGTRYPDRKESALDLLDCRDKQQQKIQAKVNELVASAELANP